nr:cation:proton antiporter [Parabacteroides sp. Marseille-P3160]
MPLPRPALSKAYTYRTVTILEGESLVNDASALVAFRFAVAAVAGSSFVLWKAGIMFLISLAGGFVVGVVLWMIFAVIVRKQRQNSDVIVGLTILLPFVAYLLAEEIHISGVIAVVTAGLIISGNKDKFSRQARVQSKSVWDTVIFILGGLIFIMIGLEFPLVLKDIPSNHILSLIGSSFLIFLTALALRILFVFWNKKSIDNRIKSMQRREAAITDRIRNNMQMNALQQGNTATVRRRFAAMRRNRGKMLKRINYLKEYKPLSLKECLIIGWSGMRGIVSLAAALSLPLLMADGTEFPQRSIIIFLTVVTVIFMLVIQGVGLPLLIRWLKIGDNND